MFWVSLITMIRVGEATNPGPFAVGCLNPNSLLGKSHMLGTLPTGIYAVSESSLTSSGVARCKLELKYCDQKFQLLSGCPAPSRTNEHALGGRHVGVAFLSNFPCRSITDGWSELFESSRLAAAKFFVANTWITGGVAYGYAHQAEKAEVCAATNELLQELTRQVVDGASGPRFVAGDWNQEPHKLLEPTKWEAKGFMDLQTWAHKEFGLVPAPTCKGSTRKDFCYICPAMQALLKSVHVDSTLFSDHAVLYGIFDLPGPCEALQIWRQPRRIPWTKALIDDASNQPCDGLVKCQSYRCTLRQGMQAC